MAKRSQQPRFYRPAAKPKTPVAKDAVLTVEALSNDGRGIARQGSDSKDKGKTVFISGALPGEQVLARIQQSRGKFDEALCLEVQTPSPDRVEPQCRHYKNCGGCELQHLDAEQQVIEKQNQALNQLKRTANIEPDSIAPPLSAEHWHYRRRTRISVYCPKARSEPVLGFRRRQSKELVPIQQCPVLEIRAEALIPQLSSWLKSCQNAQAISHIELITGDEDAALLLRHPRPLDADDLSELESICTQAQFELLLQPEGVDSIHRANARPSPVRLHYALPEFELNLAFHPSDFIQVNRELNRKMVNQAMHWLAPQAGDRVLELFSGLGNFSLPMAKLGAEVVAIEGSQTMVERGQENAKSHGLNNVSFHCADLNSDLSRKPWFGQGFNKVLLDPPRAGAHEAIRQLLHNESQQPEQILYISCDPATLARDSQPLTEQGYRLKQWGVMNMFPHTSHVESMALFVKA